MKMLSVGQPWWLVVKFHTLCFSGWGPVPGVELYRLSVSGCAVLAAYIQKEEDWQWMLAQDESSSAKKEKKRNLRAKDRFGSLNETTRTSHSIWYFRFL